MRRIALEVPLRAFAVVRRRQCRDPTHARIKTLRDALDRPTLARCVAPFEDHHQPVSGGNDPVLQLDQFALQTKQLAEVRFARLAMLRREPRLTVADAVVHFHFEFFVVGVDEILFETALPLGHRRHIGSGILLFHRDSPGNGNR
jgi:hypothetical protein